MLDKVYEFAVLFNGQALFYKYHTDAESFSEAVDKFVAFVHEKIKAKTHIRFSAVDGMTFDVKDNHAVIVYPTEDASFGVMPWREFISDARDLQYQRRMAAAAQQQQQRPGRPRPNLQPILDPGRGK